MAACSDTEGTQEVVLVIDQHSHIEGFLVFSQVLDEVSVYNIAVRVSEQGRESALLMARNF